MRVLLLAVAAAGLFAQDPPAAAGVRTIGWADLPPPVQARLQTSGHTTATFPAFVTSRSREAEARVREGDFDHLVFYVLQSTHFTKLPPIEPALSAKAFTARGAVPSPVDARMAAFLRTVASSDADPRVAYFRALIGGVPPRERRRLLEREYARAMTFLYEKEFVDRSQAAQLYQTRGLSTDSAIDAGVALTTGLSIVRALDPSRRIRRVLIVGPGLDLAPRTGMLEAGPPASYQPWQVIDALVGLQLSDLHDLDVIGADINPRVVDHLRQVRVRPPVLRVVSALRESETISYSSDFRKYFSELGHRIGRVRAAPGPAGHLSKIVTVTAQAAAPVRGARLNIVTERLEGPPFDLAVATNVLPYFGDVELALALSNIAAMLAPGGVLLHNEVRPSLPGIAGDAGLPLEQSRYLTIATVRGAPPLTDTVFLHRRR